MDREIKSWLFDVLSSIDEIDHFLPQGERVFENYKNDIKTKRAVERNLEIIGEAIKRILDKNSNFEISNSKKIIGLRNRIIHGYDVISDELIWGIVMIDLPELKSEISILLK